MISYKHVLRFSFATKKTHHEMKKALRETQTLRAGCSKTRDGQNLITFTYKPSLVRIDARNFELSL